MALRFGFSRSSGSVNRSFRAGACFVGEMAPDPTGSVLERQKSWYVSGLRLLPGLAFGPHWDMLDEWEPGVREFIINTTPADQRLVAMDEDTAIVGDGTDWTVLGLGEVRVFQGGELVAGPFGRDAEFSL